MDTDTEFARSFAREWVAAWNSHDLDAILRHYADDFTMTSPVIRGVAEEPSGVLVGKRAVAAYWAKALCANPRLHFELVDAFAGVDSVVICYRGHRGLAAEAFFFDAEGRVVRACAHYRDAGREGLTSALPAGAHSSS